MTNNDQINWISPFNSMAKVRAAEFVQEKFVTLNKERDELLAHVQEVFDVVGTLYYFRWM